GSEPVNTGKLDPDDSPMPEIEIFHKSETRIFDEASYNEEGVITDFNSLPTKIIVSPTPTLRIHNIYPKSQILGDPKSVVQTRSKVQQKSVAYALFSYIQKQQRNNHKDQQHCLLACFLSQEEPKKNSKAYKMTVWVQAHARGVVTVRVQQVTDGYVVKCAAQGFVCSFSMETGEARIQQNAWCDEFEALMQSRFQMSSMAEILKKFNLVSVKTAITPMETKVALTKDEESVNVDVHLYRSMIVTQTSHLNAVKRIFKYLKGKPNLGLWYPRESPFDLEAFSDSDYGGSNLDSKSTTCGCKFLGQRLISWQCKKQTIVATSTTEAEYVVAANCCGQNPVYHSKTKHIEIRHHFIRDCYEKKLIRVEKIHTDLNVADLLTKPFDGPRFNFLVHVFLCFRLILAGIAWICRCKEGVIRSLLFKSGSVNFNSGRLQLVLVAGKLTFAV
ncbi:hypothetical protein Tco_0389607, partial [Tanacetum coccineum]